MRPAVYKNKTRTTLLSKKEFFFSAKGNEFNQVLEALLFLICDLWGLYIKRRLRDYFYAEWQRCYCCLLFTSCSSSYTTFLAAFSSIYTFCSAPLWSTNDNKGDTTRNPEQMFENWKLGFPIGSVQPPHTSSASEHNSKFLPRERLRRNCFHFHFCY